MKKILLAAVLFAACTKPVQHSAQRSTITGSMPAVITCNDFAVTRPDSAINSTITCLLVNDTLIISASNTDTSKAPFLLYWRVCLSTGVIARAGSFYANNVPYNSLVYNISTGKVVIIYNSDSIINATFTATVINAQDSAGTAKNITGTIQYLHY